MNTLSSLLRRLLILYFIIAGVLFLRFATSDCPEILPYFDYHKILIDTTSYKHQQSKRLNIKIYVDSINYLANEYYFDKSVLSAKSCPSQSEVSPKYNIKDIHLSCNRKYNSQLNIDKDLDAITIIEGKNFLSETVSFPELSTSKSSIYLDIIAEPEDQQLPLSLKLSLVKENLDTHTVMLTNLIWEEL